MYNLNKGNLTFPETPLWQLIVFLNSVCYQYVCEDFMLQFML